MNIIEITREYMEILASIEYSYTHEYLYGFERVRECTLVLYLDIGWRTKPLGLEQKLVQNVFQT
jgi:hypothetical protein